METSDGKPVKIDPITALQEGIDGLSLAMFEALRGLRDAVAPESGNLGNANINNPAALANGNGNGGGGAAGATTTERDVEELWQAYCQGDESVIAMVQKFRPNGSGGGAKESAVVPAVVSSSTAVVTPTLVASSTTSSPAKVIQKRSEFVAWHAFMEREKDKELVERLAAAVLLQSDQIDEAVQKVPGLHRTRAEQLTCIEALIAANATASDELESVYKLAVSRRDDCRHFVRARTSAALGIEEEF